MQHADSTVAEFGPFTLSPAMRKLERGGLPIPLGDRALDILIVLVEHASRHAFTIKFAADVSASAAALMAAGQRPITEAALNEPASEPTWKSVPSWFIYGDHDKNIPPEAIAFMAERANAKETVVVNGASHVVMVSHPEAVAKMVERVAAGR